MNTYDVNLVPLQQASLCLDCEAITAAHTSCLCCGSQALLNIARILSEKVFDARPIFSRHRSGPTIGPAFDHPLMGEQGEPLGFAVRLRNRA